MASSSAASREFQSKYRNSLLGAAWTVLNPLAMIVVYTVVFSQVMKAKLPGVESSSAYSIYLCAGLLTWGLFSEIVGRALNIFIEHANQPNEESELPAHDPAGHRGAERRGQLQDHDRPVSAVSPRRGQLARLRWVLQDISFTDQPGEAVGIVGVSGAGKNALLRVLAGVDEPGAGTVRVDGHVAPLLDISLGMDLESTGYENIALRGLFLGMSQFANRAGMGEIAEFSELGAFLDLPVRTGSAGTRMAFPVSDSIHPDVLLLDDGICPGEAAFREKANRRVQAFTDRAAIIVLASCSDYLVRQMGRSGADGERAGDPGGADGRGAGAVSGPDGACLGRAVRAAHPLHMTSQQPTPLRRPRRNADPLRSSGQTAGGSRDLRDQRPREPADAVAQDHQDLRRYFSDEAVLKLLRLALRNVLAGAVRSANEWKEPRNQFAILCRGRLNRSAA